MFECSETRAEAYRVARALIQAPRGRWRLRLVDLFPARACWFLIAEAGARLAPPTERLATRERMVSELAGRGYANKAIAHELRVSVAAVTAALARGVAKLGLRSRADLVRLFHVHSLAVARSSVPSRADASLMDVEGYRFAVKSLDSHLSFALTNAEWQVVRGLLHGRTNEELAAHRATSVRTVANQLASLYRKLGVSSRHEVVAKVMAVADRV